MRKHWTEKLVEEGIKDAMRKLGIDRMPTASELCSLKMNDLHCKIGRTKTYSGWASYLNLSSTKCETRIGQKYEKVIFDKLASIGYKVERMTTKYAYDILVNGRVKVDIKSSLSYKINGYTVNTFGINKTFATCDLYILVVANEVEDIKKVMVIPAHLLKVKSSISLGLTSKYDKYIDRYDYIDTIDKAFEQIEKE